MDNIGLIGHSGFIGNIIRPFYKFNKMYNRKNIFNLPEDTFEFLICAAPTGNRLKVQADPADDLKMILLLIDHLRKTYYEKFILISTIDTLARPNTRYGMHRKILEGWVKTNVKNYSIIRLPTIIHPYIKKNILYDLKHNQWLEKINIESAMQYYDMTRLKKDINYVLENNIKELNLFSEPISNQEIVDKFFPNLKLNSQPELAKIYNIQPYQFSKEEIFASMENYFNEIPLHLW